nr:hypothetical protein [Amylibacter sp.]
MEKFESQKGAVTQPFAVSSNPPKDALHELVKHLARISAEKDMNSVSRKSNKGYTEKKQKGPNHD